MIRMLTTLLTLLSRLADWLGSRQQLEAGRSAARKEMNEEVIKNVQAAQNAVTADDPARNERLRRRFDRSRNGKGEQSGK